MSFKDFWDNYKGGVCILGVLGFNALISWGLESIYKFDEFWNYFWYFTVLEIGLVVLAAKWPNKKK